MLSLLSTAIGCWLAGYLCGGIPFALFVGKLKGVDIRKVGSGNLGAMNVGRLLGRQWFVVVFLLDMLKGLIPTLIAGHLLKEVVPSGEFATWRDVCWLLTGIACVLGHNYPMYLGFRGGKGVSTSMGAALGIYPDLTAPAIASFFVWCAGLAATRMSSVGSLCAAILFPVFCFILGPSNGRSLAQRWPMLAFALLAAVMVVVRHRANIRRILAGNETRVWGPGSRKDSETMSESSAFPQARPTHTTRDPVISNR
ncbi:MAG: glycerol-3-phosphate 1-O-acyltransferase PlsY [Planctomycetes bacterium]|nr:glycerol-3-phosphate 1-O-acyltransferase PlsY [Planctomycetota bacterium]MBI3833220.1 glycerol-3-phosphate 1-O-acyltransferase PlsY [Planctomycetota bacterium]